MKKYKIHVIQNSHTDLGYTHRQEYVYRAHARYLSKVLEIIERKKDFKWTMENFWMYENFNKWSSKKDFEKLKMAIKNGQIEITGNYLNMLNILDKDALESKVKEIKKDFPKIKVAIQQDINSIDIEEAKIFAKYGIQNIFTSINTHHGMFVGEGKQRGFVWNLENGNKINVWCGEHYMLGNELFLNMEKPFKYTFKDQVEKKYSSGLEQGITRLKAYLELLDKENYPHDILPIVLSGTVIDNSPPNESVIEGIKKINELLADRAELKISTCHQFFEELNKTKLPVFKGNWPSWWVDGIISTPEEVRQYREAQILYKNIKIYDKNNKNILDKKMVNKLERELLLFSEHTWGSWSSQSKPFLNGNNLLLSRKLAMATKTSILAWTLWDDIKEKYGYNIVKIHEKNEYKIINFHDESIKKIVAIEIPRSKFGDLEIDRYINLEDAFEIIDEKNNIIESIYSLKMGLDDNLNTSIESDKAILVKVDLKPKEIKKLKIRKKVFKFKARTSSFIPVGIDNKSDIYYEYKDKCKYLRNGIESPKYIIKWNFDGIYSIFDKDKLVELIKSKETIRPILVTSKNDKRNSFGRNRQGPSAEYYFGKLISHKVLSNKKNVQIIKLVFNLKSSVKTELNIRISSLNNNIRFQLILHKSASQSSENVYLNLPFKFKNALINSETSFFEAGKDQLPNTNLDYYKVYQGVVLNQDSYQIGIYMQDNPLIQLGSINYEQRNLKKNNNQNDLSKPKLMIWIMSNYWETNFKGTLEGTYSFAFDVCSSKDEITKMKNNHKKLLSFKVWE